MPGDVGEFLGLHDWLMLLCFYDTDHVSFSFFLFFLRRWWIHLAWWWSHQWSCTGSWTPRPGKTTQPPGIASSAQVLPQQPLPPETLVHVLSPPRQWCDPPSPQPHNHVSNELSLPCIVFPLNPTPLKVTLPFSYTFPPIKPLNSSPPIPTSHVLRSSNIWRVTHKPICVFSSQVIVQKEAWRRRERSRVGGALETG